MSGARDSGEAKLFIYGLVDPQTQELRYVGKTVQGWARPRAHLRLTQKPRTHKAHWVNALIQRGLLPEPFVIEEVPSLDGLDDAERFWIAYWRSIGARLTNATDGGDGWAIGDRNPMRDPTAVAKFSTANRGRHFSEQHKENWLHAHAELWGDPDFRQRMSKVSRDANARRWADRQLTLEQEVRVAILVGQGWRRSVVAKLFGISLTTVGRIVVRASAAR